MNAQTATREITVLNVYKFNHIARICFVIESSDGSQTYNTCFNHDANHGTCGCDGNAKWHKVCKHITNLRPRAQAYFDARLGLPTEAEMAAMCSYYEKEAAITAQETARAYRSLAFDPMFQ